MSLYELDYFAARVDPRRALMQEQEYQRMCDAWLVKIEVGLTPTRWPCVLDIGCGTGEFLDLFPVWMHRFGIEESAYATKISERRGISFDLPDGEGWADLVIMRGVLQHLPNPRAVLADAYSYLRPGGTLAILATPNADSLVYRLHGTLPCLVPELNHWIPSPTTLSSVLADLGFQPPQFHFPYWGTPYARPWRDALSLLLGRPAAAPRNMFECYARR